MKRLSLTLLSYQDDLETAHRLLLKNDGSLPSLHQGRFVFQIHQGGN